MKVSRHTAELIKAYMQPQYVLPITPKPTPRPRSSVMWRSMKDILGQKLTEGMVDMIKKKAMINVYSPSDYTKYKKDLAFLIKTAKPKIQLDNYRSLVAIFYMPYPKSTPKKRLIEGFPHSKKPDWDNYIKGLQDAIEECKLISNDGTISEGIVAKRYTTQKHGRIEFSLLK